MNEEVKAVKNDSIIYPTIDEKREQQIVGKDHEEDTVFPDDDRERDKAIADEEKDDVDPDQWMKDMIKSAVD